MTTAAKGAHTPVPWRLLDNTGGGRNLVHVECEETLEPVCSIPKARIADAELIVNAVNCHADLLEALETVRRCIAANMGLRNEYQDFEETIEFIDKAIAKARAGGGGN
jgi:hypothetical protein